MKRLFLSFLLIAMITLLAGCISIPLGDDVLEISTDGVKLIKGNSSADSDDNEEESTDEEVDDETDEEKDAVDEETDEKDKNDSASSNQETKAASTNVTCPDEINTNYSNIISLLEHEFYFPDCADLKKINQQTESFDFNLYIEGGEVEKIFNEYLAFVGEELNTAPFKQDINYGNGSADLRFYLHDTDNEMGHTRVDFYQWDEGLEISVYYTFPQDEEDDEG